MSAASRRIVVETLDVERRTGRGITQLGDDVRGAGEPPLSRRAVAEEAERDDGEAVRVAGRPRRRLHHALEAEGERGAGSVPGQVLRGCSGGPEDQAEPEK